MSHTTLMSTHYIEGREPFSYRTYTDDKDRTITLLTRDSGRRQAKYRLQDIARKKIKPIADPDAEKSNRRKQSARRSMKGRLGTILSEY